jgi:D-lyxose ketol-isomerase
MKKSDYAKAQNKIKKVLKEANIVIPKEAEIEVVDFGLNDFDKVGLGIYTKINEPEYCSKWLVLFPGQTCANHYHVTKKETFIVMKGTVELTTKEKKLILKPGDSFTLNKNTWHTFTSKRGAIIEEVSTYDTDADNYFEDKRIVREVKVD